MIEEPEAMREIHKIREQMYEEFKGLSIHEIVMMVNARTEKEWERIMKRKDAPPVVAEEKEEYEVEKDGKKNE